MITIFNKINPEVTQNVKILVFLIDSIKISLNHAIKQQQIIIIIRIFVQTQIYIDKPT